MDNKRKKIHPRHAKFLVRYVESGDVGQSYLDAGFKVKSKDVASAAGSRLLKKLDSALDFREIFDTIGLTERHIATRMKELLDSEDQQVAARTLAVVTKCTGWQREIVGLDEGAEIVIMARRQPASAGDSDDIDLDQNKTTALLTSRGVTM